jgi:hypothetical protein
MSSRETASVPAVPNFGRSRRLLIPVCAAAASLIQRKRWLSSSTSLLCLGREGFSHSVWRRGRIKERQPAVLATPLFHGGTFIRSRLPLAALNFPGHAAGSRRQNHRMTLTVAGLDQGQEPGRASGEPDMVTLRRGYSSAQANAQPVPTGSLAVLQRYGALCTVRGPGMPQPFFNL